MSELKNRVALVTGGSRGVGKAVAFALAKAEAAVAVNYRERGKEGEAVVEAIRESGGRASAFSADVSLGAAAQTVVHDVEKRLRAVASLVTYAGIARAGRP